MDFQINTVMIDHNHKLINHNTKTNDLIVNDCTLKTIIK